MTRALLYLAVLYRVWPSTVRLALDNFGWRARASGATHDEMVSMFALMLEHRGRTWLIETAAGPHVPATWWDTKETPLTFDAEGTLEEIP